LDAGSYAKRKSANERQNLTRSSKFLQFRDHGMAVYLRWKAIIPLHAYNVLRKNQPSAHSIRENSGYPLSSVTAVNRTAIEEIVRRIVRSSRPEQVILFGSAARGTAGSGSDLDFLVIKSGRYNPRTVAGTIYREMRGIARAIDLVVVTHGRYSKTGTRRSVLFIRQYGKAGWSMRGKKAVMRN
jgi:uncharacterized protein